MRFLKNLVLGSAMAITIGASMLVPSTAQAWWARPGYGWHGGYGWHSGWGWHGGWGWRGGVFIGGPAVVVGPRVVYGPPPRRWFRGYYSPYGVWVGSHWGH